MWDTEITRQLGIKLPFVGAGMAIVGGPALTAAVSNAGGLGLLCQGPCDPMVLSQAIAEVRRLTDRPFGVDFIVEDTAFGPVTTDAHVDAAASARVPLCVFFWNPPSLRWLKTLRAAGTKIWGTAWSPESARELEELGVDAVIAQSADAGGHTRSREGTFSLVPAVVDSLRHTPVVAAGGIVDGRTAAAAFTLGATAVCIGTRLVASAESLASEEYKRRILAARCGDTTVTTLFGPEWPGAPMRVVRNRAVERAERGAAPPSGPIGETEVFGAPYTMPPASAVLPTVATRGDHDEMCLAAGSGVNAVRLIQPAAEIAGSIMAEAISLLGRKL